MNADERTKIAPPRGCMSCSKLNAWICNYVETSGNKQATRYECAHGHPMHEMCGWRVSKTAPILGAK